MKNFRRFVLVPLAVCAAALCVAAQQPRLANAKVETRSASAGLEKTFRAFLDTQAAPAWAGYGVPMISGERHMCCWYSGDGYDGGRNGCCTLEGSNSGTNINSTDREGINGSVKLEGPQTMFVLFRVEDHKVEKIRSFTDDCQLDAGGLPFIWFTDVRPSESVALLAGYVKSGDFGMHEGSRIGNGALTAVVFHADPAADRALESFTSTDQPDALRRQTAFWLGNSRGKFGLDILKRMARQDPSGFVRDQVTFALSQSNQPEAVDEMIRMAREDSSSHVRGQALFWLGQKAGKKAESALTDAINNDPNTDIKKKAVFALYNLPRSEGVPLLIQVARTNPNREVRKQAMFWLGQSKDPRALDFFEEVLKK